MIEKVIERFKQYNKQSFLDLASKHTKKYAFIGVGNHSISNIYPVIQQLSIPIKIVQSRTITNAEKMASRFNAAYTNSIDDICKNEEIEGVFVCVNPQHHFNIVKKLLQAKKHVFVEKPPCTSIDELNELISIEEKNEVQCLVGLQRRYAPVYTRLAKQRILSNTYNYRFHIGAYPEGNVFYELFIHPLDTIIFLFGPTIDIHFNLLKHKKGLSLSLISKHENDIVGSVDISTLYSWKLIDEYLKVNTNDEIFEASYPYRLIGHAMQQQIAGIPLEKVIKTSVLTQKNYIVNNGLNPIKEENSLVFQGYFNEIQAFVKTVEGKKKSNKSSLKDLLPTYELIDKITKNI